MENQNNSRMLIGSSDSISIIINSSLCIDPTNLVLVTDFFYANLMNI